MTDSERKLLQEFRKSQSEMRRESKIEECFHPLQEECVLPIKQAHSLQRNGRLSLIEEDVNGQNVLYTTTSFKTSSKRLIEDFIPVGKKQASTFYGFCEFHDTNVFSPIENFPFDGSDKHLFLHSYRSFAHSYHSKKQELQLYKSSWKTMSFMPAEKRDQLIAGAELSMKEIEPEKKYIDHLLQEEIYGGLQYSLMETNEFYPFGCSSLINPHYTVEDQQIDDWYDQSKPWVSLMLTVVPDKTNSFVIVGANPENNGAMTFLDHLDDTTDEEYEKAITTMMLKFAENTFWSPKLWNYMSQSTKNIMINDVKVIQGAEKWDSFPWSSLNLFQTKFTAQNLGIEKQ